MKSFKLTKIKLRKAAPHVMFVLGVVGIVYTVVDACKAARKLDKDLEEDLEELKEAEDIYQDAKEYPDKYADDPTYIKNAKKTVRKLRRRTFFKAAKKFVRPALVGIASIVLLGTAHVLMTKAVIAAPALANAVAAEYKDYRAATREKYGDEVDKELRFAAMNKGKEKKEVVRVDKETGEETVEEWDVIDGTNIAGVGPFTVPFCKTFCGAAYMGNTYYDTSSIARLTEYVNDQLYTYHKGAVFIDDLMKRLGYDITPISRTAGWIEGDEVRISYEFAYIDWGLGNGPEGTYMVEFNCRPDATVGLKKPKQKWWGAGAGI